MKARSRFLGALALALVALALVLRGRAQLSAAFQAWHGGDRDAFRQFPAPWTWYLFSAGALAAVALGCLVVSYRRREPAWRWIVVVLLAIFLLLGLAPA